MKHKHIEGLIAAPFTPFHTDGSLHLELIPAYYKMLVTNGVVGSFICGSTGEGVSLTMSEKKLVMEAWANVANGNPNFTVIPFLGGTCIADCKDLALHAKSIGLRAVAFTTPFYFKPANAAALAKACIEIGEAVPELAFYYYHIPVLTGVHITMYELLQAIHGKLANFAGIKYTHEDFMDYLSCMRFADGAYDMLWGRDENMLSALVLGAKGAVGSTYNYAAPLYLSLIEAYNNHDFEKARLLQQQSIAMIRLLGKYGGIATGKAYMKKIGMDCGAFRLPVSNMSDAQFDLFSADVDALGFSTYASKISL
jgi:N-acetylneuraminate lyase